MNRHRASRSLPPPLLAALALLAPYAAPARCSAAGPAASPEAATAPLGPPQRLHDATRGSLLLATVAAGVYLPAPLLDTEVHLVVRGIVARAEVRQRFTNPTGQWVEGIYVFPLPDAAAVDGLELRIGERRIVGAIAEREEARRTYEAARREGHRAALLEQQRPNVFTSSVANLGPGETVEVLLRYQQELRYEHGSFRLRFPLVVAPRYLPGGSLERSPGGPPASLPGAAAPILGAALTPQPPGAAERRGAPAPVLTADTTLGLALQAATEAAAADEPRARAAARPLNPVRLTVDLDAGWPLARLASHAHTLRTARAGGGRWVLELGGGVVPADRDFLLEWEPAAAIGAERSPRATLLTQPAPEGGVHALLMVLPPGAAARPEERLPRDVVFVLDSSGSMAGELMVQAKAALRYALQQLRIEDRFNVIDFDSTTRVLFPRLTPADLESREEADQWVERLDPDGGTEMLPALRAALAGTAERGRVRQVVFLTDGSVGNEAQLLDLIAAEVGETRLFTVAIGSAPNAWFLRKAAELGRGSFTAVAAPAEVAARMGELYRRLESPLASALEVAWDDPNADPWPRRLPDLYAEEPLVVAAWLPGGGGARVTGTLGERRWSVRLEPQPAPARAGLDKLWARRQVEALTDGLHEGAELEEVRRLVIELGLRHQLVTRWTSLVAVEVSPSRPAGPLPPTVELPVALPAGWTSAAAGAGGMLPQTATPWRMLLLFGGACGAAAWLLAPRGGARRHQLGVFG